MAEAPPDDDEPPPAAVPTPADIYRAACRVAMRLVVILFAESRDLLPRDSVLYHGSYGLNGLLEQLDRDESSLGDGFGAWPRVLALFRLVWEGSHHPGLPVTAYGGELFAAGEPDSSDGVSQALAVFERACFEHHVLADRDVRDLLRLLTRTTVRIRQGRAGVRATVPVDFSDLSSEYLGILYEGLLDYELKTAPAGDPVVFLSVGDQPALPLSRLEVDGRGSSQGVVRELQEEQADRTGRRFRRRNGKKTSRYSTRRRRTRPRKTPAPSPTRGGTTAHAPRSGRAAPRGWPDW